MVKSDFRLRGCSLKNSRGGTGSLKFWAEWDALTKKVGGGLRATEGEEKKTFWTRITL